MIRNVLSFNELKKFCAGATLTAGSGCNEGALASGEAPFIGECCVAVNERSVRENCAAGLFAFWAKIVAVVMLCMMTMSGQGWAAWDGSTRTQPTTTTIDGKTYYVIANEANLAWFANRVNNNSTYASINAILTANH